jgi:hypothetical protein
LLIINSNRNCECDADAIKQWSHGILKPSSVWCEEYNGIVFASVHLQGVTTEVHDTEQETAQSSLSGSGGDSDVNDCVGGGFFCNGMSTVYDVEGVVQDAATSRAIGSAIIKLGRNTTNSTNRGWFGFVTVSRGTHRLTVSASGYVTHSMEVEMTALDEKYGGLYVDIGLTSLPPPGVWKVVLNEKKDQHEADIIRAYMVVPGGCRVSYRHRACFSGYKPTAAAGVVDYNSTVFLYDYYANSYALHSIQINTGTRPGKYRHFVDAYYKTYGNLVGETVDVYFGNDKLVTITPPPGRLRYWHTLCIDTAKSTYTVVNKLGYTAEDHCGDDERGHESGSGSGSKIPSSSDSKVPDFTDKYRGDN